MKKTIIEGKAIYLVRNVVMVVSGEDQGRAAIYDYDCDSEREAEELWKALLDSRDTRHYHIWVMEDGSKRLTVNTEGNRDELQEMWYIEYEANESIPECLFEKENTYYVDDIREIAGEYLDQLNRISEMTDEECENIEKELNQ